MRICNRARRQLTFEPLEQRQLLAANLVKDINVLPAGSQIQDALVSGNRIFFSAETAEFGRELWISEGATGPTRLLFDIQPGPLSSHPRDLVEAGERVFFAASSPNFSRGLWVSDGTTEGTKELGGQLQFPHQIVAVGDRVYYLNQQATAIWVSDGTPDGTQEVEFLRPLAGRNTSIQPFGERFFVTTEDEVWLSDGTEQGTSKLGTIFGAVSMALVAGDRAFLYAEHAAQLSTSDGTVAGTSLLSDGVRKVAVTDLRVVYRTESGLWASSGTPQDKINLVSDVNFDHLRTVGANVLALGTREDGSHELWATDGTPEGTQFVQVVADERSHMSRNYVHATTTHLYFSMNGEFWASDGTAEGTVPLRQSRPVRFFADMGNGRAAFLVGTDMGRRELWITDGTSAGTRRLREQLLSAQLLGATDDGQRMYFVADDGFTGAELWETDGSVAGTQLVADIANGTADGIPIRFLSDQGAIQQLGNEFFFFADDGSTGRELWKTNGTDSGTQLVRDLPDTSWFLGSLTKVRERLLFTSQRDTLWVTDGTTGGTQALKKFDESRLSANRDALTVAGDWAYFVVQGNFAWELWSTDGTAAGTRKVQRFQGEAPNNLVALDNHVGFVVEPDDGTFELWTARDGFLLERIDDVDLRHLPISLIWEVLRSATGVEFFAGVDDGGGELWRTDGTQDGTFRIADLLPGPESSIPRAFSRLGEGAVFWANGEHGPRPWYTDGTSAGTVQLHEHLQPTPAEGATTTAFNGHVFFPADDESGSAIWRTNGTVEGTRPFRVGERGTLRSLSVSNGKLYFHIRNPRNMFWQLWQTDATAAGTVPVLRMDGQPVEFPTPVTMIEAGGKSFFVARDPMYGTELWQITPEPLEGDLNGDGQVNFADFLILAANFNQEATPEQGDLDRDGIVNFADFVVLSNNFGRIA